MSKKRVTILLGAGASVEFLQPDKTGTRLSTDSLTNLLRPAGTDVFLDKIDSALGQINKNWAPTSDKDAYKDYKKVYLKCVEYSMHNGWNFEETIHFIDSVVDVLNDYEYRQNLGDESISFYLVDFFKGRLEEKHNTAIGYLPFNVRHYLLQHIAEHHAPDKGAYQAWCDFFVKLKKDGYSISVFNLNYDGLMMDVTEKSAQKGICFSTGFDLGEQASRFDTSGFYNADNILAQLHGSIHFVYAKEKGICYHQDSGNASTARLGFRSPGITQDKRGDYNLEMVTGLSKFEYIAKEPYRTYYRRLIRDLDESDDVIIIGYGGGDRHMNMLLKSPLTKGKKVFVVDYAEKSWTDGKVWDHFGNKLSGFLHDDFYHLDATISDIVNLSDKEKSTLFTRGTRWFLQHGNKCCNASI